MNGAVPPRRLLLLTVGFTLWANALLTLYGVNALGCAFSWPPAAQRTTLLLLLAAHIAAIVWLALRRWRAYRSAQQAPRPMPLVAYVSVGTLIAAAAATLFTLAPSMFLDMCS